jgi:hypothetical protein
MSGQIGEDKSFEQVPNCISRTPTGECLSSGAAMNESEWAEEHLGAQARTDIAAPGDGRAPSKWSKIAKNFTVPFPISLPGGGGVVGFGWIWLDWV